jgi:hypothetical protein
MLKFTRPRGIRLALSTGVLALAAAGGLATTASPASASATIGLPIIHRITGDEGLYATAERGCANIDVTGQSFYNPAPGEEYVYLYKDNYVYMNGAWYDDPQQVGFAEATPAEDSSGTTFHFWTPVSTGGGYVSGTYYAVTYDSSGFELASSYVYC